MLNQMISRDELSLYLNEYLACDSFSDYAPNGLQVEGSPTIRRICTAVTASEAVIKRAGALSADALLTHHGYFWRGEEPTLTGIKRKRIGHLITHNINLYAYHLPLDCHPSIGNNAGLAKLLKIKQVERHTVGKTANLLWSGKFEEPIKATELVTVIAQALQRTPLHISATEKEIRSIAWCSGAAQDFIETAFKLGVDAYLSGEISERTYYQAQELGIHYFSCGHHATERFGIQSLGAHLSSHFSLEHYFIDSENPV